MSKNNFSERLLKCFDYNLDNSGRLDKHSTKDQIDEYLISLLDKSKFEVKPSKLGGNGLFAKVDLRPRQIITEKVLPQTYMADGLSEYYSKWAPGKLITGVGYFANGSCRIFEELPEGTKVGPYTTTKHNVILWDIPHARHPIVQFMVVEPIKAGEEIIVNYEDPYFFPKVKTPIHGYPSAVDATKLIVSHNPLKIVPSHLDKEFIENLYKS